MTILIVDDDAHMVRSIQKNIDWEKLGIESVYTAGNVRQAKSVLNVYEVDLLLCDIEMPQGSGLDLLEWVRAQKMDIEAVFLTSYANFDYACRAIALESAEYFLKPVDYAKLMDGLKRALNKAREKRERQQDKVNSEYWRKTRGEHFSYFWGQVVNGHYYGDDAALLETVEKNMLPYVPKSRFIPILLMLLDRNGALDECNPAQIEKTVFRGAHHWFDALGVNVCVAAAKGGWAIVLQDDAQSIDVKRLEKNAAAFARDIARALSVEAFCGIGMRCFIYEIYQNLTGVREMIEDDVRKTEPVLRLSEYERCGAQYDALAVNALKVYLDNNDIFQFCDSAQAYLNELLSGNRVNAQVLKLFRLDITQMVYAYLRQARVQAHELFSARQSERYYNNAAASVEDMKAYIRHLAHTCDQCVKREKGVVDRLLEYIDENYQNEINRAELAKAVYLNADYASRLFKKETGQSISGYVIAKRMAEAKAMLRNSSIPINEISARVGYDSFAYFSKLFKKSEGVSPNEYRRRARRDK